MLGKSLVDELTYRLPRLKLCLVREGAFNDRVVSIKTPMDAVPYLAPLAMACEEHFIALHLNAKNEVIGVHEISHGTLSESIVHPREVFKAALLANSFAILLCHNHPSGSQIVPSPEDLATTKLLIGVGHFVGVNVIDHLIIGPRSASDWYSVREKHPNLWPLQRAEIA